ncbi:MAG: T9SS type A sorting domain-containing protein [Alphaproteobacteria bacterium]|nr:T9SS type A sorting domain-containing protein [Alphaproteobacteria bacterium]
MRKILSVTFLCLFAVWGAMAQTLVTTKTLNKNVVLEEYTGIHCTYCPEGHAIAASILENHPGRVSVIAIHQGSFAAPSAGEPDYRTPFGDALAGQTGLQGYPSGTVNRHIFSGSTTALNRGDWTSSSETILQQPSPVNIGVETSYNPVNRELTVHVELYYTANSAVPSNFINVALIQSHIFGPQTGGNAGNNYEHMHMLRHLITGQWGDEITTTTQGSLVEKTYVYTIPADYNSVPCVVENCDVVVSVAQGHQEILSGDVVPAINGTNLYVGDITTAGPTMKLGHPLELTTFNCEANSNIAGTNPFKIKLVSGAPPDWLASFEVDGQTVTDSTVVDLTKGTPKTIVLHVTPGFTPMFEDFVLELSSVNNPNAPVKYFTANVISNVHTLLVNAAGDNYATQYQGVYIDGLTAAGCDHLAVMKSTLFTQANDAGILSELFNIFYNCAWTFPAFTDAEAVAVKGFVDGGINLFVAGQDIGWDIMSGASGSHGTPETQDLYTNYLKASFIDDGNNTNNKLIAKVDDPIYGTTATSNIFDVYVGYMYPDQISPLADATTIFYYNTTLTKIGAIRSMKGSAKVVYFGVGLEMVQNTEVRNDILNKTYDYFMESVGTGEKTGVAGSYLGTCFPNPAHDFTTIRLSNIDRAMVVEIVDINGKTVMSKQVMPGTTQINMNTAILPAGLYLCRIMDQGSVLETKKLQVIH